MTDFSSIRHMVDISELPIEVLITVPAEVLRTLEEEKFSIVLDKLTDYWYDRGIPYYEFDDDEKKKKIQELLDFDAKVLDGPDGAVIQNLLGLGLVNSYHPHMMSIRCNKQKTPKEVIESKDFIRIALKRGIKISEGPISEPQFRGFIKIFNAAQAVSNFRPTAAKFLYEHFTKPGAVVLDPCSGYSGRIAGALSSHISKYIGCEPCTLTFEGSQKLISDWKRLVEKINTTRFFAKYQVPEIDLRHIPFEDFDAPDETFDFAFTSPPYFNIEKYSDEPTQSWVRYPTYPEWRDGFLVPLIEKVHRVLKPGCVFALNIDGERILPDVWRGGTKIFGQEPIEMKGLALSRIPGSKGKDKEKEHSFKYEPIFIFKKKD